MLAQGMFYFIYWWEFDVQIWIWVIKFDKTMVDDHQCCILMCINSRTRNIWSSHHWCRSFFPPQSSSIYTWRFSKNSDDISPSHSFDIAFSRPTTSQNVPCLRSNQPSQPQDVNSLEIDKRLIAIRISNSMNSHEMILKKRELQQMNHAGSGGGSPLTSWIMAVDDTWAIE